MKQVYFNKHYETEDAEEIKCILQNCTIRNPNPRRSKSIIDRIRHIELKDIEFIRCVNSSINSKTKYYCFRISKKDKGLFFHFLAITHPFSVII